MKLRANVFFLCCILSLLLFPIADGVMADSAVADSTSKFEIGPEPVGCPMAHCDGQMSDNPGLPAPVAPSIVNHQYPTIGSYTGLGCVSNGSLAACSFATDYGAVKVFDHDGNELWNSGDNLWSFNDDERWDSLDEFWDFLIEFWDSGYGLNQNAWMSAPIIDEHNHVIAADNKFIIRFDQQGSVVWKAAIPGRLDKYGNIVGMPLPISPIVNNDGLIFVGTRFGPMSTFKPHESKPSLTDEDADVAFDAKWVRIDENGQVHLDDEKPLLNNYYHVDNTPAFRSDGKRVYITMSNRLDPKQGALVALDIDEFGMLSPVWSYRFRSPSGASPLVVEEDELFDGRPAIFFDGRHGGIDVATIFAVVDDVVEDVETPVLLWSHPVDEPPVKTILEVRQDIANMPTWVKSTLPYWYINVQPEFFLTKTIDASFTDYREEGCFWYYSNTWSETLIKPTQSGGSDTSLRCLGYDGVVKMEIKPGLLFGDEENYVVSGLPSMTMARENGEPQLIFNAVSLYDYFGGIGNPYYYQRANKIVAVTPSTEADNDCVVDWLVDLPKYFGSYIGGVAKSTAGQFAFFAEDPENPNESATRIIFTTVTNGVHVIGDEF